MAYPAMDNWWSMLQVPIKDDKSIPSVILPEDEDNSKELQQEEPMKKNILQYITIEKN